MGGTRFLWIVQLKFLWNGGKDLLGGRPWGLGRYALALSSYTVLINISLGFFTHLWFLTGPHWRLLRRWPTPCFLLNNSSGGDVVYLENIKLYLEEGNELKLETCFLNEQFLLDARESFGFFFRGAMPQGVR